MSLISIMVSSPLFGMGNKSGREASGNPPVLSQRHLKKLYKEYSIATEKGSSFNTKVKQLAITCDIHEGLVDVFVHSFEHSLLMAFEQNGTQALIGKSEKVDAAMHINIEPLYREREDGYQAIVGTVFKVTLSEGGKEVWKETGKVDYIVRFDTDYTAHAGIRKEFAWSTAAAIVSVFEAEVNAQNPFRIYTVTEDREKHGQRVD
jgi:hypothetical protein